jgi:N-acetylmuramoyl-L-alanine amidase
MGFFSVFAGVSRGRVVRGLGCVGLMWGLAAAGSAQKVHRAVTSPWEQAVKARADFEEEPVGSHTKADFGRVMDAFRAVYHDDPRDMHAAEAVKNVAELLAEQGRELHDELSLRNAVGQYEFLRTQYPGSGLRVGALLAEGEIEQRDLHDADMARGKYRQLVKEAPKSGAAEEARTELAELGAGGSTTAATKDEPRERGVLPEEHGTKAAPAVQGLALTEENARAIEAAQARRSAAASATTAAPARIGNPVAVVGDDGTLANVPAPEVAAAPVSATPVRRNALEQMTRSGPLAVVTGIRHWSTATYTRVAIDLGDAVTFQAARVPNPDRIYFDLHGAKLGPELVGKSFSVTDDGFLKRIRAAQSSPDVTRVVLDVNDVTEYSAFLLPNPYRLIIDIHGGAKGQGSGVGAASVAAAAPPPEAPAVPVSAGDSARASVAADSSGLPAMAPTDGGAAVRPAASLSQTEASASGLAAAANGSGRTLADARTPDSHVSETRRGAPNAFANSGPAPIVRPVPGAVAVRAPGTAVEVASVSDAPGRVDATNAPTSKPIATSVNLGAAAATASGRRKKAKSADAIVDAAPAKAADKTADGETSLVRALGLKINRIVIDAGHGGHDSGTLGAGGIEEKDVVLDVALRLGKLLHDRLGAEIIYTRSDDTFIPLETRTAIANKAQADLFISIHANSSEDTSARGVETYYLNFTSDPAALDVAARENAVGGQSIHQLSDLVKKITLKDKIDESREFASDVENSLYAGLAKGNNGLKDRGVKKAPFVVLIGANMPSILAEISFVTNPKDADELRQPEYRERVAESLYNGVAKYESGLAGSKAPVQRASIR